MMLINIIVGIIGLEPIHNSRRLYLMRFPMSLGVSHKQSTNLSGFLPIELYTQFLVAGVRIELTMSKTLAYETR